MVTATAAASINAKWESRGTSRLDSALDLCDRRSQWGDGSFVAQVAAESKVSERTVQMYLRIGDLAPEVQQAARDAGLDDNLLGLYALSGLPEESQMYAISLVTSGEQRDLKMAASCASLRQQPSAGTASPRDSARSASTLNLSHLIVTDFGDITRSSESRAPNYRHMPEAERAVRPHTAAVLCLWTADLSDGLRTASRLGFKVVDSIVWLPSHDTRLRRRPETVTTPHHLTTLIGVRGKVPTPSVSPSSAIPYQGDPFGSSVATMESMWPDWAPAVQIRSLPHGGR
jgi:hypothetical protein